MAVVLTLKCVTLKLNLALFFTEALRKTGVFQLKLYHEAGQS